MFLSLTTHQKLTYEPASLPAFPLSLFLYKVLKGNTEAVKMGVEIDKNFSQKLHSSFCKNRKNVHMLQPVVHLIEMFP